MDLITTISKYESQAIELGDLKTAGQLHWLINGLVDGSLDDVSVVIHLWLITNYGGN